MKMRLWAILLTATAGSAPAQELIPVDDSYTVSQRYEAYKKDYPEIEWPKLVFAAGQEVLFDRLYKKIGARELHIDVFLPPPGKANRQAVMFLHGGAWRSGRKSNFYALANMLAQKGYAVLLPEYRLAPEASYPAGLIDINDALLWAKDQAKEFGYDAGRIALSGGSSGGQMAGLIAYSQDRDLFKSRPGADTKVAALIDLDGVLDFTQPLALQYENAAGEKSPAAQWLGGSYEKAADKWREASAASYAGPSSPPTLIIASNAPRFTAGREAVMATLGRHHIRTAYIEMEHAPHTFWLFQPYLGKVAGAIDKFLNAGAAAKK